MAAPLAIVAALGENRAIGLAGELPWRLPADLARFRRITLGHAVVMGRRTHESIGRALPGRMNIVLTRHAGYRAPGCRVARSLEHAVALAPEGGEVMVIGGVALFAEALPRARRLYLTWVHAAFAADTFFPEFDESAWIERARELHQADARNPHAYTFVVLERAPLPTG